MSEVSDQNGTLQPRVNRLNTIESDPDVEYIYDLGAIPTLAKVFLLDQDIEQVWEESLRITNKTKARSKVIRNASEMVTSRNLLHRRTTL